MPEAAQWVQPHPQEVFPFFLLRIIDTTIITTTAKRIAHMIIVGKFSLSHASIFHSSFDKVC
jgi:hypothetical protein